MCLTPIASVGAHEWIPGQPGAPSLGPLLEEITPAVVNIATRGRPVARNPLMDDPFFRRFFRLPDQDAVPRPQSLGSGVIVDASAGLIVTNDHVIAQAAEILVTLADGREFVAERVGTDPQVDIAVIRIDADELTALDWADTEQLRVGDFCLAIGNPFGLGQTVTSGIVSALGRSGLGIEEFEDFIQTDASINPGNSGGALVDLEGRLIGINTAIIGPAGGNVGIGFAIPADLSRNVVEQLVQNGRVRRGELGIVAQPLTPRLAAAFGLEQTRGVLIGDIRAGSPAERAGLEVGDVLITVDGRPVRDIGAVRNRIGLVRLGQRLEIELIRDGEPRTVSVVVEALPSVHPLLDGIRFSDARTRDGRGYVRVDRVEAGTAGANTGLREGDIVLSVNRERITTVVDFERAVDPTSETLLLLVQRGSQSRYLRLGE